MNNKILKKVETSKTIKVLALSFGKLLSQLTTLVSFIILARILTLEDFATYRQTLLSYNFIAPLLALGLPSSLYFFLPQNPKNERSVLISNIFPLILAGVFFSLFLLLGGSKILAMRFNNQQLSHTLILFSFYSIFALPLMSLEPCLVSKNKIFDLTIFNIISQTFLAVVIIIACFYFRKSGPLLISYTVVTSLIFIAAVFLMWTNCQYGTPIPNKNLIFEMIKYGVPLSLSSMLGTMTLQLSNVVVSSMCKPEDYAVFSVGAFEIPLIGIITASISTIILPEMSKYCQDNNKHEALNLFKKGALKSSLILFPILVYLFFMATPFFKVLFTDKYNDSVKIFRLYLLILPVRIAYYGAAFMALGLTKKILYRSLGDFIFNLILTFIFVKVFGIIGAVLSMLLVVYSWTMFYNLYTIAKEFNVTIRFVLPFYDLMKIFFLSLPGLIPALLIRNIFNLNDLILLVITSLLYVSITYYLFYKFKYINNIKQYYLLNNIR